MAALIKVWSHFILIHKENNFSDILAICMSLYPPLSLFLCSMSMDWKTNFIFGLSSSKLVIIQTFFTFFLSFLSLFFYLEYNLWKYTSQNFNENFQLFLQKFRKRHFHIQSRKTTNSHASHHASSCPHSTEKIQHKE